VTKSYTIDVNSEYFGEEQALAYLLLEDVVFLNNGWWNEEQGKPWGKDAVSIHVNCNDIFAWGCADAEDATHGDLVELAKIHAADPEWGLVMWCIKKRKMMPQSPVLAQMTAAGIDVAKLLEEA